MSLFPCAACRQPIAADRARIQCQQCPGWYFCANCFVIGAVAGQHLTSHATSVVKTSGYANIAPQQQQQQQPQQQQQSWQQFFNPQDWSPAPAFVEVMYTIFSVLDTRRAGYITPEAFSSFLDHAGYPVHENIWKNGLNSAIPGISRESAGDAALKRAVDAFSIEHHTGTRQGSGAANGPMPLLTLKGFMDIFSIDVLANPSMGLQRLNLAVRAYNLAAWHARGDIPAWALPSAPPQAVLDRVRRGGAMATAQATQAAQIQQHANAAAVNAVAPNTRIEYTYGSGPASYI